MKPDSTHFLFSSRSGLGDLTKYLPCVHGFDEYFGYLYHLDAMSDPYWSDYPQEWIDKTGPRNLNPLRGQRRGRQHQPAANKVTLQTG